MISAKGIKNGIRNNKPASRAERGKNMKIYEHTIENSTLPSCFFDNEAAALEALNSAGVGQVIEYDVDMVALLNDPDNHDCDFYEMVCGTGVVIA